MGPPVLHTIVFSHFCEAARWGLSLSGRSFIEKGSLPVFHVMAMPKRPDGKNSTPYLSSGVDDKGCVQEQLSSWGILAECSAPAVPENVKLILDRDLGPAVRIVVYSHLLYSPIMNEFVKHASPSVLAPWQVRAWNWGGSILIQWLLNKLFVKSPEHVKRAAAIIDEAHIKLEEMLAEGEEGPFAPLKDGSPCMATVAMCALYAPLICPDLYGHGALVAPPLDAAPMGLQERAKKIRSTKLGAFVLETYAKWRSPPVELPSGPSSMTS